MGAGPLLELCVGRALGRDRTQSTGWASRSGGVKQRPRGGGVAEGRVRGVALWGGAGRSLVLLESSCLQ